MSGSKRTYVVLFGILTGIFWFGQFVFMPYFTPYLELLGAGNLIIGVAMGIYGLAQVLIRVPLGMLSDRMNNRRLFIILGCAAGVAGAAGLWLSTDLFIIIVMRFIIGVSASCWVCFTVLYSSYFPPGESVRAVGILSAYTYLGQTLGFVAAAIAGSRFGMRSTFFVSFIMFILALGMSFFIKETKTDNPPRSFSLREVVQVTKDPRTLKIALMGMIFQILLFATFMGFTPQIATRLGANEIELSVLSFLFAATSIPSSLLCGSSFGKRFGNKNLLTITSLVVVICCFLQPFSPNIAVLFVLQGFAGFGRGAYFSMLMGLVIQNTPYEKQAVVMGFFQGAYSIGIILGPILAGAISQVSSLAVAYAAIGFISLALPLLSIYGLKNE
ncbi:MAG: MFS transporter [Christensenellales bacterium]